jgi:hypothetical protein
MHTLFLPGIFAIGIVVNANACPVGSFPSVDNWGNQICKTFDFGQTTTIQGSIENCPVGKHPWTDNWGNKIARASTGVLSITTRRAAARLGPISGSTTGAIQSAGNSEVSPGAVQAKASGRTIQRAKILS